MGRSISTPSNRPVSPARTESTASVPSDSTTRACSNAHPIERSFCSDVPQSRCRPAERALRQPNALVPEVVGFPGPMHNRFSFLVSARLVLRRRSWWRFSSSGASRDS
jgi:hypothetical protein